jgi:OOP family OmpA-OmpF porin
MKRIVLAAAALALSAAAQAENYIGATIGPSEIEVNCDLTTSCESGDTGFKIYGGFGIAGTSLPGLALEVSYVDFGKAKQSYGPYSRTVEASALTVGAALHVKFTGALSGVGRLGLAYVNAKGQGGPVVSNSASSSELNPIFGLGLEYAINHQFKLVGNADFSSYDTGKESGSLRLISVGAQMGF